MMDWDKLRIFHAVATAQSFTRAGEVLNVSQSAISRQISALEEGMQVVLFHRHARGLMLTEQGEMLFKTVSDILSRLAAVENALLESKERRIWLGIRSSRLVMTRTCHSLKGTGCWMWHVRSRKSQPNSGSTA